MTRARLTGSTKINEEISLFAGINMLSSLNSSSTYTADKTYNRTGTVNGLVDYANLSYLLIPNLSLSMGKLGAVGGGMENQYNGGDMYWSSKINQVVPLPNAGGVGFTYNLAGDTFDVQFTNDPQQTEQKNAANRAQTNAQYYGYFLDKKLETTVSYQSAKLGENVSEATFVGAKYNFSFGTWDIDYN